MSVFVCPRCGSDTRVLESRFTRIEGEKYAGIRRRRQCEKRDCGERFTTYEIDAVVLATARANKSKLGKLRRVITELSNV